MRRRLSASSRLALLMVLAALPLSLSSCAACSKVVAALIESDFAPCGISEPRYAPDGRGIYYEVERSTSLDSFDYDIVFQSSIDAAPVSAADTSVGVPTEVGRVKSGHEIPNFFPRDRRFGRLDGARLVTTRGPRTKRPKLRVIDQKKHRRTIAQWDSGHVNCAQWLDSHTVIAGIGKMKDDAARIELVDIRTGETTNVLKVDGAEGRYAEVDEVFILDPEGFVIFSVDTHAPDLPSTLYRCDVRNGRTTELGVVPEGGYWDYSPQRNTLLETRPGIYDRVFERPLPQP